MKMRRSCDGIDLPALLLAPAWPGCMRRVTRSSPTAYRARRPCRRGDADRPGGAHWVIDPTVAGDDLPPRGRSLFDFLVTQQRGGRARAGRPVSLRRARAAHARRGWGATRAPRPRSAVLIPLGRSLQRNAAAPEYFASPRAVVAAVAEPAGTGGLYLKDRLYLGYQEKANLIEVISYNEDAGRFEFQVVTDYRAGGTPRIAYANRTMCIACHQNAAPIFSRPVWDETNANPRVARAARRAAQGLPWHSGRSRRRRAERDRRRDAARQPDSRPTSCSGTTDAAATTSLRVTCRAGLVRGAAPVPAVRAAAIRSRRARRIATRSRPGCRKPRAGNGPAGSRSAIPTCRIETRFPSRRRCHLRSPLAMARASRRSPPHSIRCCRARRSTSGASPDRMTSARLVIGLAEFIAEPDVERLDSALIRRAAGSRHRTPDLPRQPARSTRRGPRAAASASNSAARLRRRGPIAA